MRIDITLKNYRCFSQEMPVTITIDEKWTAFVGINNAGKSTLMRFLFEFKELFAPLANDGHWGNLVKGAQQGSMAFRDVPDPNEVFHHGNAGNLTVELATTSTDSNARPFERKAQFEFDRQRPGLYKLVFLSNDNGKPFPLLNQNTEIQPESVLVCDSHRASLKELCSAANVLSKSFYIGAFRNALNIGGGNTHFDIRVGDQFIKHWHSWQTGSTIASRQACIQVRRALQRQFGFNELEIMASDNQRAMQLNVDGQPYNLTEQGSGLAQFLIVFINLAMAQPELVMIDEPETNLHPSLQLDFLRTLGTFAKSGLLYSTHNIGLARATAGRIYTVIPQSNGASKVTAFDSTPDLPDFIDAMTYSSFPTVGAEVMLLVEGPTEVPTLKQFLRLLKIDARVLLLPLHGRSGIEGATNDSFQEYKRINLPIYALIDSEKTSEESQLHDYREEFEEACNQHGIVCHILDRRAIENYLTKEAIQKVKGVSTEKLKPYQKRSDISPSWRNNENWLIAAEMSWDDIKGNDLGKFLAKIKTALENPTGAQQPST